MSLELSNGLTTKSGRKKYLFYGQGGTGKTTTALTLPAPGNAPPKRLGFLFDPAASAVLEGHDIDFKEFLPDQVNTQVGTMSQRDAVAKQRASIVGDPVGEPEAFNRWREFIYELKQDPELVASYNVILFDSLTTFSQLVMDRQTWINSRLGGAPQQDDYLPAMTTIMNNVRDVISLFKNAAICFTAHEDYREDKSLGRQVLTLMVIGQLRVQIPLCFSEVLRFAVQDGKYWAHVRKDARSPVIRSTLPTLEEKLDITIPPGGGDLSGKGLGKYYAAQATSNAS